jgi:hypothetical protein
VGDGFPQGRVVGEGILQCGRDVGAGLEDILGGDLGVHLAQLVVVRRAEKGEGSRERTRADSGDALKLRSSAGCRPTDKQAGTEGPVLAAAGNRQELGRRKRPLVSRDAPIRLLSLECRFRGVDEIGRVLVSPVAYTGHAGDGRLPLKLRGHRILSCQFRTAEEEQRESRYENPGHAVDQRAGLSHREAPDHESHLRNKYCSAPR